MSAYPKWILTLRRKTLSYFNRHSVPRWMVFIADTSVVFIAFIIAYLLRFNFSLPADREHVFILQAILATSVYGGYCLFTVTA